MSLLKGACGVIRGLRSVSIRGVGGGYPLELISFPQTLQDIDARNRVVADTVVLAPGDFRRKPSDENRCAREYRQIDDDPNRERVTEDIRQGNSVEPDILGEPIQRFKGFLPEISRCERPDPQRRMIERTKSFSVHDQLRLTFTR